MPHNRTRLWVGLAIIAVTISAVGTFYTQSTRSAPAGESRMTPISAAGRANLTVDGESSLSAGRLAVRQPVRDYQAEVTAALARNGVNLSDRFSDENDPYDDFFDIDPLDDAETDRIDPPNLPDPSTTLASRNPVAYSTEGPVEANVPTETNDPEDAPPPATANPPVVADLNQGDDYGQSGTMSDSDVYRLVVNNLGDNDRDDFVRAYATMSAEDRANLLDGFRQQIQGGP